jgi:polyisoprenoid-binding protein YceI
MKRLSLIALLLISVASFSQTWTADKVHSSIGFTATHMVIAETTGSFKDYEIIVTSSSVDFADANVEFTAKTASLSTENEMRDGHLKSDDFFNAEKFPEIKFKGKLVKKGKKYSLVGKLTLRETTKDVIFPVVYKGTIATPQFTKAGFSISGSLSRFDYGLKWDKALEAGGLVVGKDITLVINVELNKAK